MARLFEQSELFKIIRNEIFEDGYLFGTVHGPPRSSKSTIGLWCGYSVYEDWNKTLQSCVFSLPSLVQHLKDGKPELWPTSNGLHNRVPFLLWDDALVNGSNKAVSQHSTAFDEFKAAFDVLGTRLGVLLCTMVDASGLTSQLQGKYNFEVFVNSKGKYKLDRVIWKQDYSGFRVLMRKEWIENGTFEPIPRNVYLEYDALRQNLADESFVRLEDALAVDTVDQLLKILKPSDIALLRLIETRGPLKYDSAKSELGADYKNCLTRCRARSLVLPTHLGNNNYKIDLSSIGFSVLAALDKNASNTVTTKANLP
jgi:hypothetical protein